MITIRKSADRGAGRLAWLDSRYTFSFSRYYDPAHMGFGSLRVINEDVIAPAKGFGRHGHDNMEIITYMISGALQHQDSLGTGSIIRVGDVQRMSAGRGIEHSEVNASAAEPAHLLQIWILPNARGLDPSYEQKSFDFAAKPPLCLIASPDGREGSLKVHQDVEVYRGQLGSGEAVSPRVGEDRLAWLQVVKGALGVNGHGLEAGDGTAIQGERGLEIAAGDTAEFLVFDMAPLA